jgi:RNA polymerase sigma factor (sigma-70 family)
MSSSASRMHTLSPLRLPRLGDDRLAALAAGGDERAFEALYDRHHRALLGFCRHMLGTLDEAEDALQQTFLRAHRALASRGAPTELRPWLYTIARNCCLTMLSARRPAGDDDEARLASTDGLGEQVQTRADLRAVVADVERLPEDQRAALVLAELADLSHEQIAEVIGVRAGKVKALIHQGRTTLIAERDARDTPCASVREELATARGGALRRGPLRRHLRLCDGCRAYRVAVDHQRRALALALPVTPSLGLKAGVLGAVSATGGAGGAAVSGGAGGAVLGGGAGGAAVGGGAGGAAVGGSAGGAAVGGSAGGAAVGGATAVSGGLAAKVVATAIIAGGTAAGGVAVVDHPERPAPMRAPAAAHRPAAGPRAAAVSPMAPSAAGTSPAVVNRPVSAPAATPGGSSGQPSAAPATAEHGQGQDESGGHGQGQGEGQAQGQGQADPSAESGRPASKPEANGRDNAATKDTGRPASTKGKERPASSGPPGQVKKQAASGPKHSPAAAKPEKAPKGKAHGAQPTPVPTPAPTAQPQSDNKPDKPGKDKSKQDDTASNEG